MHRSGKKEEDSFQNNYNSSWQITYLNDDNEDEGEEISQR